MIITYEGKLLEKKEISQNIFYLKFDYPKEKDWDYKAGQYMIFHIPVGEERAQRRLYSIASSPENKNTLDFIIEIIPNGVGSEFVNKLRIGGKAKLQGPAGLFTLKEMEKDIVFLATGTGIAPMYSMLNSGILKEKSKKFTLLWGMKKKEDLYLVEEFEKLAKENENFNYEICLSREEDMSESDFKKGRITDWLENTLESRERLQKSFYYLCGGKHVVESLKDFLSDLGIEKDSVHFEKFT